MSFSKKILSMLVGAPFGTVYPPRKEPPLPSTTARGAALAVLGDYLAEITFYRKNAPGKPPIPFRVERKNIVEAFPDYVDELEFPSIVFVPGAQGEYQSTSLTSFLDETTLHKYGLNTALQVQSEFVETFTMQVLYAKDPEGEALVGGLEVAFMPTEQCAALRLKVPAYYDQIANFSLNTASFVSNEDSSRNRRITNMEVELSILNVRPVLVSEFVPAPIIGIGAIGEDVDVVAKTGGGPTR